MSLTALANPCGFTARTARSTTTAGLLSAILPDLPQAAISSPGAGSTTNSLPMPAVLRLRTQPRAMADPIRPAPISTAVVPSRSPLAAAGMASRLARGFEHHGGDSFFRRLAGPDHEVERRQELVRGI